MRQSDGRRFVIWFFFCIVVTELGVMPIANIAHGTGAVVGALLGLALSPRGMKRELAWVALGSLTLGISLACTVGRPYVNYSEHRVWELNFDAYHELEANEAKRAVELLERATEIDDENVRAWHNLGVAYGRLGKRTKAKAAFDRSEELERLTPPEKDSPEGGGIFDGFKLGE